MANWNRRLSAAQAKQPGTARRPSVTLPGELPPDIQPDDQAALLALGQVAKDRPGFQTRLTVRQGAGDGDRELTVEVAHGAHGPRYEIVESSVATTADEDDDDGGQVIEMLADALVVTSDIVAIFESVGAEALWANDAFATAIPIREADRIWLIELLDDWSKGHFEVNVLPALVQHGRWHGRLVLQPDPEDPALTVMASVVAHRDPTGEIEAITLVARDLEPVRDAEARIASSDSRLAALVEDRDDIIFVVLPDGAVLYASPAATALLDLDDADLDGTNLIERVHPDDLDKLDVKALAEPDVDGVPPTAEIRLRAEDGGWRVVELVATDLTENPAIGGVVLTARDLTDRVEAVQRLADRAYTDPLTLLPNRMRLLDRLGSALQNATEHSIVTLLFDVDRFSEVNADRGHATADELLRQVAHRLADETRPNDVVARLAGDTFAMVMRDVTDVDSALVAADRIKGRLSEPYRVGTEMIGITVSVGIAVSHEGQAADELLGDADVAVGIAKQAGGDRIEVLTGELRNSAARRRSIEDLLNRALTEGDGVEVHYQPIFDLASGRVAAAEALLRVHDDEGALLSPASFLEAAEHSGLIGPLGGHVLSITCTQLARWATEADADAPAEISVNVSPRQLSDPTFAGTIASAIETAGIDPSRLSLEITESMMIGERGIIDDVVVAVRGMGVAIGLDDFGAGQSSFGYLKRFPLDFVKVDRELVAGLGRDEGDTAIVRATVDLAHSLGLKVIAVGVENDEQLEILQFLGVDRAQGFYYAPALPAGEFAQRVRSLSLS